MLVQRDLPLTHCYCPSRKLREANVLRSTCHSVYRRGGGVWCHSCLVAWSGALSVRVRYMMLLHVWLPGSMFLTWGLVHHLVCPSESDPSHGPSQGLNHFMVHLRESGPSHDPSQGERDNPWRATLWREISSYGGRPLVLTSSGSHQSRYYASFWNTVLLLPCQWRCGKVAWSGVRGDGGPMWPLPMMQDAP